ncbi:DUF4382 domain-containing protein [Alteromonas halophila]|uniref:Lipoprotein n=1 Tax=Alteromonas halophila TaxID=516698 RepID=A0A918JKT7_9ALTE|nr:DUF4382 domain-containing protein [Alteromonas halophila]GGW85901.1 lipoprotein [Alteromonas halophila]
MKFSVHPLNSVSTVAKACAIALGLAGLTACGGSDTDSPAVERPAPDNEASFSLAVSDAPVDSATEVVVYFDTVELTGNGDPLVFDVRDENGDPRRLDLLALQGQAFATIVEQTDIPSGEYGQVRLVVTDDSYIVMDEGTFPLQVPSGELKLDGFTAAPGAEAAYTAEFDLRKSLVNPVGQQAVFLKPRGVRLVLNDEVGQIEGSIDNLLLDDPSCAQKMDLNTGNAVYVYQGEYQQISELGDDASPDDDDDVQRPYTIIPVNYDQADDSYRFNASFLPADDYTLSFSCTALFDEPESEEGEAEGFTLQTLDTVTVTAGNTTTVSVE